MNIEKAQRDVEQANKDGTERICRHIHDLRNDFSKVLAAAEMAKEAADRAASRH